MTLQSEIITAVEILEKKKCFGVIALINNVHTQEKKGKGTIIRTSFILSPDDEAWDTSDESVLSLKTLVLGRDTGTVLGDLVKVAMNIEELSDKVLKKFDECCAEAVKIFEYFEAHENDPPPTEDI